MILGKEPIKLATIKEQVYEIIKDKILSGELKSGDWLQESKLAESLNVSRSPVREALKELVGEGLLENIPNKGVFVKTLSIKDIYNIFEFREVMEKYAIMIIFTIKIRQIIRSSYWQQFIAIYHI